MVATMTPSGRKGLRRIEKLIEEACVDAYTESEQEGGFLVGLEENLVCPSRARVIGEEVDVVGFDMDRSGRGIVAKVRRGGRTYTVNVTALEWGKKPPPGAEWIDAYIRWGGGSG
jgi:hypothetical protein